jgi:hypothetical protein
MGGAFALLVLAASAPASSAEQSKQKTYPSAEEATGALFLAVQAGDEKAVSEILGGEKEIFSVGDKGQDELDRQQFLEKYQQMHRLAPESEGIVLYLGAENWPFPFPLMSTNGAWAFDSQAGTREILYRRIGANESYVIDLCQTLGRADPQAKASPVVGNSLPSHGYYFRALQANGKPAYILAYPAEYRSSGVMTFVVGPDDIVYERDLGPRTAAIAKAMTSYKRDSEWHAVPRGEPAPAPEDGQTVERNP